MSQQSTKKKPKKRGQHTLVIVAILLSASGFIRLGSGTGKAIAEEINSLSEKGSNSMNQQSMGSDGIANLLADLKEREARVEARELQLENRFVALEVAEAKYSETLSALIAAEDQLDATIIKADAASETDLNQLTSMYENMKPKDAAVLFGEMAPDFSSGFLARMRPDAAASILAGLDPETAYAISVILAGRNAQVPRDGL